MGKSKRQEVGGEEEEEGLPAHCSILLGLEWGVCPCVHDMSGWGEWGAVEGRGGGSRALGSPVLVQRRAPPRISGVQLP